MFQNPLNRRTFLQNSLLGMGILSTSNFNFPSLESPGLKPLLTVQEIMDRILKEGNLSPIINTVDTLKSGTADQFVTGIVSTMFPNLPLIEESVRLGANFMIVHEPSYYNHNDSLHFVENSEVLKLKMDVLEKNKIAVWRFHDYIHSIKPDMISYGVAKKLGWESYLKTDDRILNIPEIDLKSLIVQVKKNLNINHLRYIGDPHILCSKIALMPGAVGGQNHLSIMETQKPDVILVGECPEWETVEYMRDSQFFGRKTALVILGHGLSEAPGMEYFAEWLKPKVPDLKVHYLPFKDPFTWV